MELIERCYSFNIKNKFNKNLTVIIEYNHYVLELSPDDELVISVSIQSGNILLNVFDLQYRENQITVLTNNIPIPESKYRLYLALNGIVVYAENYYDS